MLMIYIMYTTRTLSTFYKMLQLLRGGACAVTDTLEPREVCPAHTQLSGQRREAARGQRSLLRLHRREGVRSR